MKREQQEIRTRAEELARDMQKLAKERPQYDAETGLKKKLAELATQVESASQTMQGAATAAKAADAARGASGLVRSPHR